MHAHIAHVLVIYLTVLMLHQMIGQMQHNYCQITILFALFEL